MTEVVEVGVLRLPRSVRVLAEHDPGLVGVQFETQGSEPLRAAIAALIGVVSNRFEQQIMRNAVEEGPDVKI